MEFYVDGAPIQEEVLEFQFPTGWNSTEELREWDWTRVVSIPNGMEFYAAFTTIEFPLPQRFNSQRDGILHLDDPKKPDDNKTFQFPTGWNST